MTFSKRIKQLRTDKNFTLKQLADIFYVDTTTVGKWEQAGIIPNGRMLERICDYFGISLDYLIGRSAVRSISHEVRRVMEIRVYQNEKPFTCKILSYADMTPDDINIGLENDFFISMVLDDAMQPLIYPTDMLLIARQEKAECGDFAFLTLNDKSEGIVRKVVYSNNVMELHSINPYYPIKIVEDASSIKIYGVVKKLTRRFKEDR